MYVSEAEILVIIVWLFTVVLFAGACMYTDVG